MKKNFKNILLVLFTVIGASGCKKNTEDAKQVYDNETRPLVFATQELDGVFNPFYYSSGTDASIIGMTQISMFTTDKNANIAYGKDEPVVVLDYQYKENSDDTTTYTFVLKNPTYNVKYSNGTYVTLQDVLFNMYEYLDPAYVGSSTMYSTDIVGLKEYRTQQADEDSQDAFEEKFSRDADERVEALLTAIAEIKKAHGGSATLELLKSELASKSGTYASKYLSDLDYIGKTFKEELYTDYKNNMGSYVDDKDLESDVEYFLYCEGYITIDLDKKVGEEGRIDYALGKDTTKNWTMDQAVEAVYNAEFPDNIDIIATGWQTATTIRETFTAEAKEEYFKSNTRPYKSISGIKVIDEDTTINGTKYSYAQYDSTGALTKGSNGGYEMFSITINGVDPKAIWNFSFSVAPMYYYSNSEQINKFDYVENFGVEYGSTSFQNDVIKDADKLGVPMGAGAYMATDKYSNSDNLTKARFFDQNIVYFKRNENFLMGAPKIKMIRYQVTPSNQMLTALLEGQVDYCEPNAKQEIINQLNSAKTEGFQYEQSKTLGYGYIGINAKYIPNVHVRRAIMYAMNTTLTLQYYVGAAEILHRPMSKVSWAYPTDCEAYYPYDSTGETTEKELNEGGYHKNSQGIMVNDEDGKQLKLTFTIAGSDPDHPSAETFYKAQEILNGLGCDVNVTTDTNALIKLTTGSLQVWAAAWSTTIDPDMYQTYHIKSTASSTLNWGYDAIKADTSGKTYAYEQGLITELSEKIEEGRETLDQEERKEIYSDCLDLVMDLAVELPTYQRNDLFAFNANVLDRSTMTPHAEISPYNGLINEIWNLSLVTE